PRTHGSSQWHAREYRRTPLRPPKPPRLAAVRKAHRCLSDRRCPVAGVGGIGVLGAHGCPLLSEERTSNIRRMRSAFDPQKTSAVSLTTAIPVSLHSVTGRRLCFSRTVGRKRGSAFSRRTPTLARRQNFARWLRTQSR